ncbi:MAG: heat shock protein HspQ [Gammaproteobacteria bacterium]|nr:heat shock protein HspQ [Gammaproteobacteria bacterium]
MSNAKFSIGEIVHHKLFNYRGVIFNVDDSMQLSDKWYKQVAKSKPPKNKPWYHVMVDNQLHTTYVAEQNLEVEHNHSPIVHPFIDEYFFQIKDGRYLLKAININ